MRLCLEKVPLLALSALSCAVTMIVQKEGGAMQSFSLLDRISNALTAYVQYMVKMIWPANLSALYPHPEGSLPFWQVGVSALVLAAITLLVFRYGRRFPFLPVGWFWYLGTLVPVIGLVQVGTQAMADRYTYIPLIGLFLMAVWSIPKPFPSQMKMWGVIVAVLLLVLMVSARNQVDYWKDSPTLFQHALEVTEDNYLAEHDLGMVLILSGKPALGLEHLDKAVKIKPDWGVAYANLAMVHFCLKNIEKAREYARLSQKYGCELDPSFLRDLSEKGD
jgi:tetratricopeptide (TPR) repeat protein